MMLALLAAPALAASGNGLYKPYPAVNGGSWASNYYAQLGISQSDTQLTQGTFSSRTLASASTPGPSRRAGVDLGGLGLKTLVVVGLLALLASGASAWRLSHLTNSSA